MLVELGQWLNLDVVAGFFTCIGETLQGGDVVIDISVQAFKPEDLVIGWLDDALVAFREVYPGFGGLDLLNSD